ncbi:MAG: hypothetical protein OHK0015_04800 [Chloroflexi bacterium OHK40]
MRKINVLFMQSQDYFGADSLVHSLLMRHFNRTSVTVYAACNAGSRQKESASLKALSGIEQLNLRPTYFGPSINHTSKREILAQAIPGGLATLASLTSLAQYIRKHSIDVIHCTEKPRDAFYGLLLARLTGARCVIHIHVKAENWISPLVQWAMRHADALVGVSQFVADSIVAMGYPANKTHAVLNSLDLNGWRADVDGSGVRQEYGVAPSTPLLAIVSRLFYWKGHVELLRALGQVKATHPDFKLLIVGADDPRGMPGRGSFTAELKALSAELGLNEHVIFTGFRQDVPQVMAACDIYAMPSFEEPFGMVYLEAMAMRKPVIALDNGGAREVIEHGKSGLLSQPQDIDQLAANIRTLLDSPTLRVEMGAYGRQQVEQFFTPQRMAHEMERIYRSILGLPQEVAKDIALALQ